jgi:hypothetical protein
MDNDVNELILALKNGTMSLEEVAQQFRQRTWPRRRTPPPTTYLELAASAQRDPEPDIPGSFDDVDMAYERGEINEDQYDVLAAAMAESLEAEDRGKN